MLQGTESERATSDAGPSDEALAALIDEHSAAVYRLARSVVGDPALSDDVTQETFIKVWRHIDKFRGEGSIRSWILRIAHRESINALRRRRDTVTEPQHLDQVAVPSSVPREVEGRLAMESFREALDALEPLSRAILVLREIEQLRYDEIASTLDIPLPTVKSRLLRARRQVSNVLEDWRI